MRNGKAYEHTIIGLLTLEEFDVYQPVVDDQGIDGIIRFRGEEGISPKYYELQVKGSKTWDKIRCKVERLTKQGVLILYCAEERQILWFLYEELAKFFPKVDPQWGDIFLKPDNVKQFKAEKRDDLAELRRRLTSSN
jgi:hypothetical protein